ncbi:MAG TPA: DUF3127 domain-containing protein [Bacteroidales bacterium]|mgnify:FL=1|nr:hypothetical protein [Bacteroidales bacterium]HOU95803.1 DUF3127 domain-containing protein [Bacteroidales bacterium]HQG52907.1 DUF3127 domain-containing protein [Bacteroidales bacterium]HQJ21283.1 DUF3127 domain-containing protein [Bacteroidales bacterium]HRC89510.1 DUF3127 domain-containing protein [Bacteroidales bacterium]
MAFELTGKVVNVFPVVKLSDKFRKREFVIEKKETGGDNVYIDYVKFQLVQEKCELIDDSFLNEDVRVWFSIKGNRWEKDGKVNYFTNLDAWKIEKITGTKEINKNEELPPENLPQEPEEYSDLPF